MPSGPTAWRRPAHACGLQAALTTLFERMQRVQTRRRWMPPFTIARTRWRFGSNRAGVTLCAWLTFRPDDRAFSANFAAFRHQTT